MRVEDRGGDAAHPLGTFLVVDGKAPVAGAGKVAEEGRVAGEGQGRELLQPLPGEDTAGLFFGVPGEKGLADAAGVRAALGLAEGAATATAGVAALATGAAANGAAWARGSSCSRMNARTLGYTRSRQRRPLKMP